MYWPLAAPTGKVGWLSKPLTLDPSPSTSQEGVITESVMVFEMQSSLDESSKLSSAEVVSVSD